MSLDWNVKDCDQAKCFRIAEQDSPEDGIEKGDKLLTVACNSAIWATMVIGIGHLTEKTIDEAVARCRMVEDLDGAFMRRGVEGKDGGTEIEDVFLWECLRDFVGLRTNVSYVSKTKWLGHHYANVLRQTQKKAKQ